MKAAEVAPGVYRLGTRWVNLHVVQEAGELLLIDAGYPRYWPRVRRALEASRLGTVGTVIATHHHIDHVGMAERFRLAAGCRVHAHPADTPKVCGTEPSHPPPGFYRQAWRPSMARYLLHSARWGGASYRPVGHVCPMADSQVLDAPGMPEIVYTPGHTAGHCCVLLRERDVLIAGDAMVNFDYATGRRGIGLHRFNEDRTRALASLERLEGIDADTVLFGHGEPWRGGVARALDIARSRG